MHRNRLLIEPDQSKRKRLHRHTSTQTRSVVRLGLSVLPARSARETAGKPSGPILDVLDEAIKARLRGATTRDHHVVIAQRPRIAVTPKDLSQPALDVTTHDRVPDLGRDGHPESAQRLRRGRGDDHHSRGREALTMPLYTQKVGPLLKALRLSVSFIRLGDAA